MTSSASVCRMNRAGATAAGKPASAAFLRELEGTLCPRDDDTTLPTGRGGYRLIESASIDEPGRETEASYGLGMEDASELRCELARMKVVVGSEPYGRTCPAATAASESLYIVYGWTCVAAGSMASCMRSTVSLLRFARYA